MLIQNSFNHVLLHYRYHPQQCPFQIMDTLSFHDYPNTSPSAITIATLEEPIILPHLLRYNSYLPPPSRDTNHYEIEYQKMIHENIKLKRLLSQYIRHNRRMMYKYNYTIDTLQTNFPDFSDLNLIREHLC